MVPFSGSRQSGVIKLSNFGVISENTLHQLTQSRTHQLPIAIISGKEKHRHVYIYSSHKIPEIWPLFQCKETNHFNNFNFQSFFDTSKFLGYVWFAYFLFSYSPKIENRVENVFVLFFRKCFHIKHFLKQVYFENKKKSAFNVFFETLKKWKQETLDGNFVDKWNFS